MTFNKAFWTEIRHGTLEFAIEGMLLSIGGYYKKI